MTPTRSEPDVLQQLRDARGFIDHPNKWCRGSLYTERGGRMCAVGALDMARHGFTNYSEIESALASAIPDDVKQWPPTYHRDEILTFNDSHKHRDVMALFDRAIEHQAFVRKANRS